MPEFIDTNVLLYAYDPGAGEKHERSRKLVQELALDKQAATSIQILQEFYVNATQKIAARLKPYEAQERIEAFSLWTVHKPKPGDVVAASEISEETRISFWDAMVVRSAGELGCRTLWSEDLNDGQEVAGVKVKRPWP